jgi:hypothetical protein
VPSETFFATTAQVLPALLIAFAIEAAAILRDPLRGWRQRVSRRNARMYRAIEEDPDWTQFKRWQQQFEDGELQSLRGHLAFAAYLFLAMVVVGEVGATWVMFLGVDKSWFTMLASWVCVATMTFSVIVVAGMPIARLMMEVESGQNRHCGSAGCLG